MRECRQRSRRPQAGVGNGDAMSEYDDFSEHPKSVFELRSDKTDSAHDWTPRDVLIDLLRAIDSKKINPTALVVAMRSVNDDGAVKTDYRVSSPDHHISVGVVQSALFGIQRDGS